MIYEFSYELYDPVLQILHVTMEVEAIPVETYNRFGPSTGWQIGDRKVIQIRDDAGNDVKFKFREHIPEILDHFHEAHSQRFVDRLYDYGR